MQAVFFYASVCVPVPISAQAAPDEKAAPIAIAIPFSAGGVSFEPYQEGADPLFDALLAKHRETDPDYARPIPVWGQFTNATDKDIVVITSIWDCVDSSGEMHRYTLRGDQSFGDKRRYPKGYSNRVGFGPVWSLSGEYAAGLPMNYLKMPVTVGNKVVDRDSKHYEECNPLSFEIDVVILEDGTVLGKDGSGTVALLQARKKAIDLVTEKMLALLDRQRDPTAMLTEYADEATDLTDPVAFWSGRVAKIFLESPNQRARAAQLSLLPTLIFH